HAFRLLGAETAFRGALVTAIGERLGALRAEALSPGPPVHVLMAALEAAGVSRATSLEPELLAASAALAARGRGDRDAGLLHCRFAELLERFGHPDAHFDACGLGAVSAVERDRLLAAALPHMDGHPSVRAALVPGLLRRHDGPTHALVVAALPTMPVAEVESVLFQALQSEKHGTVAAACEALERVGEKWPGAWTHRGELPGLLDGALVTLERTHAVEGLLACLKVVGPRQHGRLLLLSRHGHGGVRRAARAALDRLG